MRTKIRKVWPAVIPALLALTTYELVLPAPAAASHPCQYYAAQNCHRWESLGYTSWEDCIYWELPVYCGVGAGKSDDTDLASVREE